MHWQGLDQTQCSDTGYFTMTIHCDGWSCQAYQIKHILAAGSSHSTGTKNSTKSFSKSPFKL